MLTVKLISLQDIVIYYTVSNPKELADMMNTNSDLCELVSKVSKDPMQEAQSLKYIKPDRIGYYLEFVTNETHVCSKVHEAYCLDEVYEDVLKWKGNMDGITATYFVVVMNHVKFYLPIYYQSVVKDIFLNFDFKLPDFKTWLYELPNPNPAHTDKKPNGSYVTDTFELLRRWLKWPL